MLVWLCVCSEVHIVCMWSSWCHCIHRPHRLLPHLNPDWFYLSLTGVSVQVVMEKRPLNGCNSCNTLQVFILLTLLALCAEQGLCNGRVSVCLSICLSHHSTTIRRCGRFAAVGPADRRYRSIAEWPSLSSDCKQCHIVSRLRKLNRHTCSLCREWPKSFGKMIYAMLRVLCWGYYEQLWLSYWYW